MHQVISFRWRWVTGAECHCLTHCKSAHICNDIKRKGQLWSLLSNFHICSCMVRKRFYNILGQNKTTRHLISFSAGLLGYHHTTKSSMYMPPCVLPLTPLLTSAVSPGDDLVMWRLSASCSWSFYFDLTVMSGPIQTGQLLSVVTVSALLELNCNFTTRERMRRSKIKPQPMKIFQSR